MEDTWRWSLVAAIAPVAWGANYVVTRELLPADAPLWGAALRAAPAGLLLLAGARRLPHGSWWWRSAVLGALNVGAFFVLIYVAAQLLPSSVAATIMASSPIAMTLLAWAMLRERPTPRLLAGGVLGLAGVALLVMSASGEVNLAGVAASGMAMVMSALGYTLTKKWASDIAPLTIAAWQLVAGGFGLVIVAVVVEGAPPAYTGRAWLGLAYTALVATAAAYVAWFAALRRLPAGTLGLVGLLNPLTGVLLGVLAGGEHLTVRQAIGVAVVVVSVALGQRLGWLESVRTRLSPSRHRELVSCRVPVAGGSRSR